MYLECEDFFAAMELCECVGVHAFKQKKELGP